MGLNISDVFLIITAIILPPVPVAIRKGCGTDLWINILLTILGFIPGVVHAIYLIAETREVNARLPRPSIDLRDISVPYSYGNPDGIMETAPGPVDGSLDAASNSWRESGPPESQIDRGDGRA